MDIHDYRSIVTIVPNSGIHFLDFAFNLGAAGGLSGVFWEQPKPADPAEPDPSGQELASSEDKPEEPAGMRVVLRKLHQDDDGNYVFWDDDTQRLMAAPEDEIYSINVAKAMECFVGQWIPIPFLRLAGVDENGREILDVGPSNWARVHVTPLEEIEEDGPTHRVVIAFDTALRETTEGRAYLAPSTSDSEGGETFKFGHEHEDNAWFLNQPWVAMWLQDLFRELKLSRKRGRPLSQDDFPYACEHWARYSTFLDVLGAVITVPKVKLIDVVGTHQNYEPIDVDLVLDIGNSRTCGILIESMPDQSFDFNDSYVLELRDLASPWKTYAEPFESRLEFSRATFGRDAISRRSTRADAFVWPSLVRVGHEAARLSRELDGTEGATGLSSPKRYLWDDRMRNQPWRFNMAESPPWNRIADVKGAATTMLTDDGEVLSQLKMPPGHELPPPAIQAQFSRSSLFSLMLAEILLHALTMINAPNTRGKRRLTDVPRRLRRLVLTVPPATPLAEQRILRHRVQSAVSLVWELLGWDISTSRLHKPPVFHLNWDEASCTHMVYLYTEITQKLQSNAGDLFALLGKPRAEVSPSRSLRIASIDIGGGTTDLMIVTYRVEGERSIIPHQEFREGFKIAGDDVLEGIIESQVLKAIEDSLSAAGVVNPAELLQELFGGDRAGLAEQTKVRRSVFVNQVLIPIALGLIADYEQTPTFSEKAPIVRSFGEFFADDQRPAPDVTGYLEDAAKARGGDGFALANVSFAMDSRAMAGIVSGVIGEVLTDLCEVIAAYDCDLLLLSGRPSKMPAVRDLIVSRLPVPPDRVIAMHSYHVGAWYPFADTRMRVSDPKTTAAVGAMLCVVSEGQVEGFSMRSSMLTMRSTARFIGVMERNGQIRKTLFSNVDLEAESGADESCEVVMYDPMFLGFRQLPIARWTATRLYHLEFANASEAHKLSLPLTVKLERVMARREEDTEQAKEDFRLVEIIDADDNTKRRSEVVFRLQTLKDEQGYWLDTGVLTVN